MNEAPNISMISDSDLKKEVRQVVDQIEQDW